MVNNVQTELTKEILTYLNSKIDFYAPCDIGDFRSPGARIALDIQTMNQQKRYYNGRVRQWFQFKVLAKSLDWQQATDFLDEVKAVLERARSVNMKSQTGSFNFISAEAKGPAAYAGSIVDSGQKDNAEYVVYATVFTLQATINNNN